MYKKASINKYTPEGRKEIHKELEEINPYMLIYLMKNYIPNKSIEYNDNRIALYVAQKGKCAITGEQLEIGKMHCHHIIPIKYGGSDKYENLIFITDTIHKYIHGKDSENYNTYFQEIKLSKQKLDKLKELKDKCRLTKCKSKISLPNLLNP